MTNSNSPKPAAQEFAPEDSAAKHRAKQTVVNLVLSLVACLGIVIVTVLAVPRDDSNRIKPVDYVATALAAEESSQLDLVAPELPTGWWANQAKWNATSADGVKVWKVGFVGPKNQYVGVVQGFAVNPTWVALQTVNFVPDTESTSTNNTWTNGVSGDELASRALQQARDQADMGLGRIERPGAIVAGQACTVEDLAEIGVEQLAIVPGRGKDLMASSPEGLDQAAADIAAGPDDGVAAHAPRSPTLTAGTPA